MFHQPQRRLLWVRISHISKTLLNDFNPLSDNHFQQIAEYIQANYPYDKNLPRTSEGIRAYFLDFYQEPLPLDVYLTNEESISGEEVEIVRNYVETEVESDDLSKKLSDCVEKIKNYSADEYYVICIKFDINDPPYATLKEFEKHVGGRYARERLEEKCRRTIKKMFRIIIFL